LGRWIFGLLACWLLAVGGLVVGCGQAVAWSKALLYDIIDYVQRGYRLGEVHTYVDDIAQTDVDAK
jgi:hypothetical protein